MAEERQLPLGAGSGEPPEPLASAEVADAPEESKLPGPFAVGRYACELRDFLRGRARVQLLGEVTGLRKSAKSVYFELRDAGGAVNCAMWRSDWDALELTEGSIVDGVAVIVGGGPDYYPGSATASPSFSFRCTELRLAGEGDLIAQLAVLRRKLFDEGLFDPQRALPRPALPKAIGIVTGRGSAAEADLLAGLRRRSWAGRAIFAHPPVQDRHAAPQITRAIQDLAAIDDVELILIARGGGSLADLWAFCDETLCRTVAMLRVPVVAAVGHESDRTLLDDVAAISCSTPTHAVEAAIAVDVSAARRQVADLGSRLAGRGAQATRGRAGALVALARAVGHHTDGQRRRLHQMIREIRAGSRRALTTRLTESERHALVLGRKGQAAAHEIGVARRELGLSGLALRRHSRARPGDARTALDRLEQTIAAHDPDRVLERGYAIVTRPEGDVITSAEEARASGRFRVRFADDDVGVEVADDE